MKRIGIIAAMNEEMQQIKNVMNNIVLRLSDLVLP